MLSDIKEKWGKIRSIGGMTPSPEKEAATKKWFEEGEFKEWLIKLENSLPEQVGEHTFSNTSLHTTSLTSSLTHRRHTSQQPFN
jgi:hypothetical protein